MRKVVLIARILLGLIFFVFGLIGLLNLIPPPEDMSGPVADFTNGLMATGYMMPLIKVVETVSGALLLSGFFVPLALVLLAPIVVNIFLLHAALEPAGLPLAILILALEIFLAWAYRANFRGVLAKKAVPTV